MIIYASLNVRYDMEVMIWFAIRAIRYRKLRGLSDDLGTAVVVQVRIRDLK